MKILEEVSRKTVRVLPCLVNRWLTLSTRDAWVNKAKSTQAFACPLIVWLSAYRSITIYDEIFQSQRTLTRGTTTMFLSDFILNDKNWKREKCYCNLQRSTTTLFLKRNIWFQKYSLQNYATIVGWSCHRNCPSCSSIWHTSYQQYHRITRSA